MTIIVQDCGNGFKGGNGFKAWVKGDKCIWGWGHTARAAINSATMTWLAITFGPAKVGYYQPGDTPSMFQTLKKKFLTYMVQLLCR